jgi:septum formation protein
MQIILGSSSERRKYILDFFSLPYLQVDSNFDESLVSQKLPPDEYTKEIARQKALKIADTYKDKVILTADTVVYFEEKYLLKPQSEQEAFSMLKKLSGSFHEVYTGVCVKTKNQLFTQSEKTKILFNELTDREIKLYHKNFYFSDKSGGYAIQKGGSIVIKKIEGCFYNIMGLPINTLRELLKKAGIDLWNFLKPL